MYMVPSFASSVISRISSSVQPIGTALYTFLPILSAFITIGPCRCLCVNMPMQSTSGAFSSKSSKDENPLNYLRIKKSCDLLRSGEYSVAEAAAEVGINDLCYYYKLYAKFMGGTPREQASHNFG